jgi:hypothetical protein
MLVAPLTPPQSILSKPSTRGGRPLVPCRFKFDDIIVEAKATSLSSRNQQQYKIAKSIIPFFSQ